MKERFSAGGSPSIWLKASRNALKKAGFSDIELDKENSTVTGYKDGPITIKVSSLDDGQTALELDSDQEGDIAEYKQAVARSFQILQQQHNAEPLGGTPEDLKPDTNEAFQNAFTDEGTPKGLAPEDNIFVIPGNVLNDDIKEEKPSTYYDLAKEQVASDSSSSFASIYDQLDSIDTDNTTPIKKPKRRKKRTKSSATDDLGGRVSVAPNGTVSVSKAKPWYESDWFTLLCLILIPPVGIALMWYFKVYDSTLRKYLTAFFCVYTVLWAWLLALPFLPDETDSYDSTSESTEYVEQDEETSDVEEVENYWDSTAVSNFIDQMPALMTQYEQLYINGDLYSDAGIDQARAILPQVQDLSNRVLSMSTLSEDNAAYPLQTKVNECAEAFSSASTLLLGYATALDYSGLRENTSLWSDAESLYYEIDYLYQRVLQSAYQSDGLEYEIPDEDEDEDSTDEDTTEDDNDDAVVISPSDNNSDNSSTDNNNNNNNGSSGNSGGSSGGSTDNSGSTTTPSQGTTTQPQETTTTTTTTTTETVITEVIEEIITYY